MTDEEEGPTIDETDAPTKEEIDAPIEDVVVTCWLMKGVVEIMEVTGVGVVVTTVEFSIVAMERVIGSGILGLLTTKGSELEKC